MQWRSNKNRVVSDGLYPLHRLTKQADPVLTDCPPFKPLDFTLMDDPTTSILPAMREFQAMLDTIRDGAENPQQGDIPKDPLQCSEHLKGFAYFNDASMVGVTAITSDCRLQHPIRNADIAALAQRLQTEQTKTLAAGVDLIMADLKAAVTMQHDRVDSHNNALVILNVHPRTPDANELGCDWLHGAEQYRSALRANENAVVLAQYIRTLGYAACAHSATTSELDLNRLTVMAGLARVKHRELHNPFVGSAFSIAVVSTNMPLTSDQPLAANARADEAYCNSLRWRLGLDSAKNKTTARSFNKRRFSEGEHPFETLKRVEKPTTFIDEPRVPRVPKRADMFARAQFGDMGKNVQRGATAGYYVRKSAPSAAQRRALGAMILLQDGVSAKKADQARNPKSDALTIKAMAYYLGADAVAISRCPEWTWYSHDATGKPVTPPHDQAISLVIDQGYDTMEGASGDDWISVAQSMRAYLRFSLIGSIIAKQIRLLGYKAKAHSVMDGEVLQPPLLLLSGLGEVSRIGEVILNPFLGPRLKSGAITTDLPLWHDKPIDFGLQKFCEGCNKCARECPSGAITAGPKTMFNGYEIYKSDSQKCATYRITVEGGAMCGRCMKTCPWNLEGIFSERPFRYLGMRAPSLAPALAKLDDALGRGSINETKKWWWDIELKEDGSYSRTSQIANQRQLQPNLKLYHQDQTLAVYPAPLAPHPYPYPDPMDREAGIAAYQAMLTPTEHQARLARGEVEALVPAVKQSAEAPVLALQITAVHQRGDDVIHYTLQRPDNHTELPKWTAGAHIDVVVAPEFLREYSMLGNPQHRDRYEIAVLKEPQGRGGSELLQRIFSIGRRVFVSPPINHFPLHAEAQFCYLMGGGIGITPMIAMAHELHAAKRPFALHYSASTASAAGFTQYLQTQPWASQVSIHISKRGSRANFGNIFANAPTTPYVYTCGPDNYMDAVFRAALDTGIDEDHLHREYFSVPDEPEYQNHPFRLYLQQRDQWINVAAEEPATDALIAAGIPIDVKCSDGLCGVCRCEFSDSEIEHRDHVLSRSQRENHLILCRSRAAQAEGVIKLNL